MKLPVIRHLQQNVSKEQLLPTLEVLECISEARGLKEEELDVIGELITNICGALEVHDMVENGMKASEALNGFAKKVMSSIDQ